MEKELLHSDTSYTLMNVWKLNELKIFVILIWT